MRGRLQVVLPFFGIRLLLPTTLSAAAAAGGGDAGYAFLEFRTHEAADMLLKSFNGQPIPGTDQVCLQRCTAPRSASMGNTWEHKSCLPASPTCRSACQPAPPATHMALFALPTLLAPTPQVFRLNWAAYGVGKAQPAGEDCASLFVGDLAPDVSDIILQEYFRQFYPSVRSAKVITDAATGRSKGYGFVRFRWVGAWGGVSMCRGLALAAHQGGQTAGPLEPSSLRPLHSALLVHLCINAALCPPPLNLPPCRPASAAPPRRPAAWRASATRR